MATKKKVMFFLQTFNWVEIQKYICKLLFIFLLGHDIDFGHMEAVNLLSSNKYTEKQIVSLHYAPNKKMKDRHDFRDTCLFLC